MRRLLSCSVQSVAVCATVVMAAVPAVAGTNGHDGAPKLSIVKTASVAEVRPGGKVTYTVTATNIGTAAFTNRPDSAYAWFVDDLDLVLDDATYDKNAQATFGKVKDEAVDGKRYLEWEGALGAGAKATVTYSVTVRTSPASGADGRLENRVKSTTVTNNCGWDVPVTVKSLDPASRAGRRIPAPPGCSTVTVVLP